MKGYLLCYENFSCFTIIMDYCNFFFTLTLLGNRWVPWFLLGTWLFYAHSRGLLGLISLREMKDYSKAKGVGLPASFLRTQPEMGSISSRLRKSGLHPSLNNPGSHIG